MHSDWLARKSGTQDPWQTVQSILDAKTEGSFELIASIELQEKQSAPDLKGFATFSNGFAICSIRIKYISARYFGGTAHKDGDMYKKFLNRKVSKYDTEDHIHA